MDLSSRDVQERFLEWLREDRIGSLTSKTVDDSVLMNAKAVGAVLAVGFFMGACDSARRSRNDKRPIGGETDYGQSLSAAGELEVQREDLMGIWWGCQTDRARRNTDQQNWVIERKQDGTFQNSRFVVDNPRKVYCWIEEVLGSWELKDGKLHYQFSFEGEDEVYETVSDIEFDGETIRWTTDVEGSSAVIRSEETRIRDYDLPIGPTYKKIDYVDFQNRVKQER